MVYAGLQFRPGIIGVQVAGRRIGQLLRSATDAHVVAVGTTRRPEALRRILKEARGRVNGKRAVGVDNLIRVDPILLQVARPVSITASPEHRYVQVIEVLRAVKRVDRYRRRRER